MNNVHRLGDFQNRDGSSASRRSFSELYQSPDDLRCIDMFFPGFTFKSFIFWISAVQAAVYIATVVVGSYALRPTGATLNLFGDAFGPDVQRGQIWRLVTPLFLHGSIWHILINVYFQMRMGFPLEQTYGIPRFILLYFVSGIGGNLLSTAWAFCTPSVGASTAGFGLIGIQMAELALMWHAIGNRDRIIFNVVTFVVLALFMSFAPESNIDWRGHLGGFIAGFAMGIIYNKEADNPPSWVKQGYLGAIGTLCVLYISCLAVIFAIPASSRCKL